MSSDGKPQGNGKVTISDIDNLGAVLSRLSDRLDEMTGKIEELEQQVERISRQKDGREGRLDLLLDHANRIQRDSGDVVLNYKEISAATGCSVPTAYADMDWYDSNIDGIDKRVGQSGKTHLVVTGSRLNG